METPATPTFPTISSQGQKFIRTQSNTERSTKKMFVQQPHVLSRDGSSRFLFSFFLDLLVRQNVHRPSEESIHTAPPGGAIIKLVGLWLDASWTDRKKNILRGTMVVQFVAVQRFFSQVSHDFLQLCCRRTSIRYEARVLLYTVRNSLKKVIEVGQTDEHVHIRSEMFGLVSQESKGSNISLCCLVSR